jgi:hypothetical protein
MIPQANQVFIVLFLKSVECAIKQVVVVAPKRPSPRKARSPSQSPRSVNHVVESRRDVALIVAVVVLSNHPLIHRVDISCLWPTKPKRDIVRNGMELK